MPLTPGTEEALGAPSGPAEAFEILARSGHIDAALGVRLAGAAGLRNVIVHQYTQIDVELILEGIRADPGDLERFVLALRS